MEFFLYKKRQVYGHLNPRTHLVKVTDAWVGHYESMSNPTNEPKKVSQKSEWIRKHGSHIIFSFLFHVATTNIKRDIWFEALDTIACLNYDGCYGNY